MKKGDDKITISTHLGSAAHQAHNNREERVVSKEPHIDRDGIHETWIHEPVRHAYDRLFGQAVKEYNENQSRDDRKIDSYYNKIRDSKQQHPCYELIVQVGSKENPISREEGKEILREYAQTWGERNPNLELVGCYYHADERGEPHLHIDFVPHATYDRGLSERAGLTKALEQQGHERKTSRDTPQIRWERSENSYLERLCRDRGHEVEHPQRESPEKAVHRANREFKAIKEDERIDRLEREVKKREINLKAKELDIEHKTKDYDRYNKVLDRYLDDRGMTETQYQREVYLNERNGYYPPEPEKYNPDRSAKERAEIQRAYDEHSKQHEKTHDRDR